MYLVKGYIRVIMKESASLWENLYHQWTVGLWNNLICLCQSSLYRKKSLYLKKSISFTPPLQILTNTSIFQKRSQMLLHFFPPQMFLFIAFEIPPGVCLSCVWRGWESLKETEAGNFVTDTEGNPLRGICKMVSWIVAGKSLYVGFSFRDWRLQFRICHSRF